MQFLFLSHWVAERMATTERLASALERRGHSVVHFVAPCRNPITAYRYNRTRHPIASFRLWSPLAHDGPVRGLDLLLSALQLPRYMRNAQDLVVVLQSHWLVPLAQRLRARVRVYAALDEVPGVDSRPAVEWADTVFCLSPVQEALLRSGHSSKRIHNIGQCGRLRNVDSSPRRDATPTIVYAGLNHRHLERGVIRELASLPATLLLVGCQRSDAFAIFNGTPPKNVECSGWLMDEAYERAIGRGWVGVIPYDLREPWAQQCNPDKVYDYLAAGLRVVATEIPALASVPGVTFARPESFVATVREALAGFSAELSESQMELGRIYSPDAFASRFLSLFDEPS